MKPVRRRNKDLLRAGVVFLLSCWICGAAAQEIDKAFLASIQGGWKVVDWEYDGTRYHSETVALWHRGPVLRIDGRSIETENAYLGFCECDIDLAVRDQDNWLVRIPQPRGSVAGEQAKFRWARIKLVGDRMQVLHPDYGSGAQPASEFTTRGVRGATMLTFERVGETRARP